MAWLAADWIELGQAYSAPYLAYCNAVANLGFFLIVAWSLSTLKIALSSARTDCLTGVYNNRGFFDLAKAEFARCRRWRQVLTVAYIGVDDFKVINDRLGHRMGDTLLKTVASALRQHIRATDAVCRLGGDEFTLLLPGTDSGGARTVLRKLQHVSSDAMRQHQWPVTFSIGAVTFLSPPERVETMINRADCVMYAAKQAGKNRIRHELARG